MESPAAMFRWRKAPLPTPLARGLFVAAGGLDQEASVGVSDVPGGQMVSDDSCLGSYLEN